MDETALAEGVRTGDERVFEALIRTETGRLLAVARRILGNEDEAREAVHEAFISAYRAREQFHAGARVSTWLHRIAINAALMKLRARRRRPEDAIDDLLPRFLPDGHHTERFAAWGEPVDELLTRKETCETVRRAIDRLPESFRTVLLLRDIEGLSTDEAAGLLKTTPNAVKIRLHRARMALRTLLAPHFAGASLMTCREVAEFLHDYLASELPPPIAGEFEQHLERCANCREFLAQYRTTVAATNRAWGDDDVDAPGELVQAILHALRYS